MNAISLSKQLCKLIGIWLLFPTGLLMICTSIAAKEISGIQIPEQVTLSNNMQLKLNGAGIRTKFFFDIYIGALYTENLSRSAPTLISARGTNRILMHFLYDGVSKEKITDGWIEGFENNNSKQEMNDLKQSLDQFNALFTDAKKGDVILLDYIPLTGTEVRINNELKGIIAGEKFNIALRKVWLGEDPVDSDLKEALVGSADNDY